MTCGLGTPHMNLWAKLPLLLCDMKFFIFPPAENEPDLRTIQGYHYVYSPTTTVASGVSMDYFNERKIARRANNSMVAGSCRS